MFAEQLLAADSFDGLMALLAHHQPGDPPLVIVNGEHNSAEVFVDRLRRARGLCGDFDGTFHPGNQWAEARKLMPPHLAAEELVELAAYLRRDDHIDLEDLAFILGAVKRLHGQPLSSLHGLAEQMPPRPGAIEFMRTFDPSNVAIVSYGIWDVIQAWVQYHLGQAESLRTSIFALRLKAAFSAEHDRGDSALEACLVQGCDPATVVSNGNKGYMRDTFCAVWGIAPQELAVLGDAPTDVLMMDPSNVGVLIIPKVDPEPDRMAYRLRGLPKLWDRVSAVYVTGQSGGLELLHELRTS